MDTTGSTGNFNPPTPEQIRKAVDAIDAIKALPKLNEWMLFDPSGRAYKGTIEDITRVVLQHHPLMKPLMYGEE